MGVGPEPDRDTRGDEQQALEEIRRLFERYREIARHAMPLDEHDEQAEEPEGGSGSGGALSRWLG